MHTPEEQAWDRDDLFQEVQVENVEDHRADRPRGTVTITLCHTDLSTALQFGPWVLHARPLDILQKIEKSLPAFLRDMEAGVPEERRSALPSNGFWSSLSREGMVVEVLVLDSEE